jgi:hypothetical protein
MFFHQTEVITGLFLKLRSEGKLPSDALSACHRRNLGQARGCGEKPHEPDTYIYVIYHSI